VHTPIPKRYFEDFSPGMVFEFGDYLMSEQEIVSFARAYDPQPYHLRRDPGPQAAVNELIASGWHTCAATMRMMVDHFNPPETILPAGGVDSLRWLRPVRPGDRLRVKLTVLETRPSASKPDRGIVKVLVEVFNQRDEAVMTQHVVKLFRRRPAA
jgi:acyl dehydratase